MADVAKGIASKLPKLKKRRSSNTKSKSKSKSREGSPMQMKNKIDPTDVLKRPADYLGNQQQRLERTYNQTFGSMQTSVATELYTKKQPEEINAIKDKPEKKKQKVKKNKDSKTSKPSKTSRGETPKTKTKKNANKAGNPPQTSKAGDAKEKRKTKIKN